MRSFGAVAISFRVGQIHWADVASQVGEAERFVVHVVDITGVEHEILLEAASKWCGGWSRQLRCPVCGNPARVLSLAGDTTGCGRCLPRSTKHHTHKNSRAWCDEGVLVDRVLRALLRKRGAVTATSTRLARRATTRTLARAAAASELASSFTDAIDSAGLLDQ